MGYVTVHFPPVTRTAYRNVKCVVCGKRRKRQKTFEQTINPFNRNAAGQPKTRREIWKELDEQSRAWQPTMCATCEYEECRRAGCGRAPRFAAADRARGES